MSTPVIQYFGESGTWVKPEGAIRVDIVLAGGDGGKAMEFEGESFKGECGGNTFVEHERDSRPAAWAVTEATAGSSLDGDPGRLGVVSLNADDLPGTVEVTVGKGGRPGGRDGYALVITHLAEGGQ